MPIKKYQAYRNQSNTVAKYTDNGYMLDAKNSLGEQDYNLIKKHLLLTLMIVYDSGNPNIHLITTPMSAIKDNTEKAFNKTPSAVDKSILVLYTIEQAVYLHICKGIPASDITVLCDGNEREDLSRHFGFSVIRINITTKDTKIMKNFGFMMGNPPYNEGNSAPWKEVITKLYNRATVIAMVTPRNVVNGEMRQTGASKTSLFNDIKSDLTYINFQADSCFDVGKGICSWVVDKSNTSDVEIKTGNGKKITVDLSPYNYLPYNLEDPLDYLIFDKIYKFPTMLAFGKVTKKSTGNYLVSAAVKKISLNYTVVSTDIKTDARIVANDLIGYTLSDAEVDGCNVYVNSKMFAYLFNLFGGSDVRCGIFRKFPILDFTKRWVDADIYAFFGITSKAEIDHIENTK